MSILTMLFGTADDVARQMASTAAKSTAKKALTGTARKAATSYSDDLARTTAKQAAKATSKAGKSTAAQQIAKNEFDDYLTSLGASKTLRQDMAKSAYNGVLGKTPMANRFKTLNVDLANVADKSAAGRNAYGSVMNDLFDYMDNAGVGVDLSGLKNAGNLFTKAQKNRLAQLYGIEIDDLLNGRVTAKQANDLYKMTRDVSRRLAKSQDATQSILADPMKKLSTQIRDKLDDTASSVSKSFGLRQRLQNAADSIGDAEVARAYAGLTDDAVNASMARAEMAPYMQMEDFIGLQAPAEKTLNVIGIDTGVANPLPKATKAIRNTALKAKDKLSTDSGKNAAMLAAAGGAGILGGLLGSSSGGGQDGAGGVTISGTGNGTYGATADPYAAMYGATSATGATTPTASAEPTIGGYTYDDLDNAYVSALMAGDADAAAIIQEMTSALDARVERQAAQAETTGGTSGIGSKQQAAIGVLNSLMSNFQAQGPVQGSITNILNAVTGGNYNYQTANYQDQGKASLGMLIKAMGDSGTLSDGDTQRALGLIPDITDSPEKAQNKYDTLMQMLISAGSGS